MAHPSLSERPLLLDVYSGSGGAAMGYFQAGFAVIGVDNDPKPLRHYPFPWLCADALETLARFTVGERLEFSDGNSYGLEDIAAIHASPPCQAYSRVGNHARAAGREYPDLVGQTWWALEGMECPWVIENVPGAPLDAKLMLCGSMFAPPMSIRRHRIFESNIALEPPDWPCRHRLMGPRFELYEHYKKRLSSTVRVNGGYTKGAAEAMGIDWMTHAELVEAIPPAYCKFIGEQLLRHLEVQHDAR